MGNGEHGGPIVAKLFRKHYHLPGTAPGTLRRARPAEAAPAVFMTADRSADRWGPMTPVRPEDLPPSTPDMPLHWINVQGTPTAAELRLLGERLGLHPLALEDVLNSGQRPKLDRFEGSLVIVLGIPVEDADGIVSIHQLSLFMGATFVLSITADGIDAFAEVRRRLSERGGRVMGEPDYLVYGLMDAAVDHAFPVLDSIGERIEVLEQEILDSPGPATMEALHELRRELIILRRQLWPTREVVNQLLRDHADLFTAETRLWMRDVYDHTVQIMDLVESYRDMAASLVDIHLSTMSNRLNETIRRLTVIATIFMPLTFIAGVYGMNFEHPESPWAMPELGWYWGYPMVWIIMIAVAGSMLAWFRSKRWF